MDDYVTPIVRKWPDVANKKMGLIRSNSLKLQEMPAYHQRDGQSGAAWSTEQITIAGKWRWTAGSCRDDRRREAAPSSGHMVVYTHFWPQPSKSSCRSTCRFWEKNLVIPQLISSVVSTNDHRCMLMWLRTVDQITWHPPGSGTWDCGLVDQQRLKPCYNYFWNNKLHLLHRYSQNTQRSGLLSVIIILISINISHRLHIFQFFVIITLLCSVHIIFVCLCVPRRRIPPLCYVFCSFSSLFEGWRAECVTSEQLVKSHFYRINGHFKVAQLSII